jgi:hypothetical protein
MVFVEISELPDRLPPYRISENCFPCSEKVFSRKRGYGGLLWSTYGSCGCTRQRFVFGVSKTWLQIPDTAIVSKSYSVFEPLFQNLLSRGHLYKLLRKFNGCIQEQECG